MEFNQFLEYKNFGFNVLTVSAIATILFATLEGWAVVKQKQKILLNESGKSIANIMFILLTFVFISFIIYGIEIKSLVLIFNGILFLFYFSIIKGLYKYKGFSRLDKFVFLNCVFGILLMLVLKEKTEKELLFFLFISASLIASVWQPLELWKEKDPGSVEIKLVLVLILKYP